MIQCKVYIFKYVDGREKVWKLQNLFICVWNLARILFHSGRVAGDIHCLHFFAIKSFRDGQTLSSSSTKSLTVPSFYDGYRSDKDAYAYGLWINHTKSTTHLARSCQTTRYRMTAVTCEHIIHAKYNQSRNVSCCVCFQRQDLPMCFSRLCLSSS